MRRRRQSRQARIRRTGRGELAEVIESNDVRRVEDEKIKSLVGLEEDLEGGFFAEEEEAKAGSGGWLLLVVVVVGED